LYEHDIKKKARLIADYANTLELLGNVSSATDWSLGNSPINYK